MVETHQLGWGWSCFLLNGSKCSEQRVSTKMVWWFAPSSAEFYEVFAVHFHLPLGWNMFPFVSISGVCGPTLPSVPTCFFIWYFRVCYNICPFLWVGLNPAFPSDFRISSLVCFRNMSPLFWWLQLKFITTNKMAKTWWFDYNHIMPKGLSPRRQ